MGIERMGTHSDACYKWHLECAAARVEELRARVAELEAGQDEAKGFIEVLDVENNALRARVAELEAERASLLEAAQKARERAARLELKHGRLTTGGPDV